MISAEAMATIERELILLSAGRWKLASMELQEEGEFLFVMIEVSDTVSSDVIRSYLEEIKSVIRPKVPTRPKARTWLVAARQHNEIVESDFE